MGRNLYNHNTIELLDVVTIAMGYRIFFAALRFQTETGKRLLLLEFWSSHF